MSHHSYRPVLVMTLLIACTATPPQSAPAPAPAATPKLPERQLPTPAMRPAPTVDRLMDSLSVHDKVAQLVMPWLLGGYEPLDGAEMTQALNWVDSLHVGGIIISIGSPTEIAAKLNALQRVAPLPLLIASDLEGGTTFRFSVGGTQFPTQMGIGAGGREEDAYQMGRITALEGRAVGIQMAFAPVADVNSNPDNPIINTRSFGGDPAMVARFVAATIRGLHDNGMLSTAKHFPGHGDTETDSHLSMPTITSGWARFDTLELVPFRAAIAAGVDAVMSAHISLPGLDPGPPRPGTLSPAILTGVLRDSLHFKGLIATDALSMGAIVKEVGAEEAPILAFLAGSDLLLMPSDAGKAIDAMVKAVESGRISRSRLDESVRRILELKMRLGLFQQREVDIANVARVVGRAEFRAIGDAATKRSITLLKDSLGTVDSIRSGKRTIGLVVYGDPGTSLGNTLASELRQHGHTVRLLRVTPDATPAQRDSVSAAAARASTILFATSVRAISGKGTIGLPADAAQLVTALSARRPTVMISFGSPYLIAQVSAIPAYLIAWSNNSSSEVAVANALTGAAITGKAPIDIPPMWPIGSGLQRSGN